MGIVHPNFFRLIGQADLHAVVAAGSEGAARGQVGQVHRGTGDGDQLVVAAVAGWEWNEAGPWCTRDAGL